MGWNSKTQWAFGLLVLCTGGIAAYLQLTLSSGAVSAPRRVPRALPPELTSSRPSVHASSLLLDLPLRSRATVNPVVSGALLGWIHGEVADVFDVESLERRRRLAVGKSRGAFALGRGALTVVGARTWKIPARAHRDVLELPRFTLLPGSWVLGDRRVSDQLWVHQRRDTTLYGYDLESGTGGVLLAPKRTVELAGYNGNALIGLRDGSFLYTVRGGLKRYFPGGRSHTLEAGAKLEPERLLLARRIDQVFVVTADHELELHTLTRAFPRVGGRQLSASAFDVVSAGDVIAVLEVKQGRDRPRSWQLLVFRPGDQEPVFQTVVPADPGDDGLARPDWVTRATQNFGLALVDNPPRVIVGGPHRLLVWDYLTGKQLLEFQNNEAASANSHPGARSPVAPGANSVPSAGQLRVGPGE